MHLHMLARCYLQVPEAQKGRRASQATSKFAVVAQFLSLGYSVLLRWSKAAAAGAWARREDRARRGGAQQSSVGLLWLFVGLCVTCFSEQPECSRPG